MIILQNKVDGIFSLIKKMPNGNQYGSSVEIVYIDNYTSIDLHEDNRTITIHINSNLFYQFAIMKDAKGFLERLLKSHIRDNKINSVLNES